MATNSVDIPAIGVAKQAGTRISRPRRRSQASSSQLGLSTALARLETLRDDEGDYDDRFLAPAFEAMESARTLIAAAYPLLISPPPLHPAPLGDGGLFVRWKADGDEVSIIVPPPGVGPIRLYHRLSGVDGVVSDPDGITLAAWIRRLSRT